MNKLLCFNNGQFVVLDDIVFVDNAYREALKGLLSGLGITPPTSFKLSGCDVIKAGNTYTCSEGYIALAGEIYHVPAHTMTISDPLHTAAAFQVSISYDPSPAGNKMFYLDSIVRQCYQIREAKLLAAPLLVMLGTPWNYMPYNAPNFMTVILNKINSMGTGWLALGDPGNAQFKTGWINAGTPYAPVAYSIDAFGVVRLKGVATQTDSFPVIFTLPIGFRPNNDISFNCAFGQDSSIICVYADGRVYITSLAEQQTNVDLSTITFKI